MKDFKTKNISEEQKPETKEAEKKLEKKTNIYSTGKYLCIIASAGVCFCLIIVNFMQYFKFSRVMNLVYEFCKDTSNAEQAANLGVFVNNLETTNMLNTGFTIISIAITVWIGLNIYNVVSKEYIQKAIEEYNEEMLILEQKREEKMQFIFKKTVFINLLYMTGKRYYASEFFADLFWNTDKEYEKLDLIIEYEKEYIQCCRFYENSEKLNANRVAEDLIAKYKELGSKEPYTEYADTDPMKNFIRMRLSDVYFYKNMTCDKEQFNLQEMKESVELYETVIDNPSKIEFWDEKVDAYFCNSQGYTLRTMSKHEENEKDSNCYVMTIEELEMFLTTYKKDRVKFDNIVSRLITSENGARRYKSVFEVLREYQATENMQFTGEKDYFEKIVHSYIGEHTE